MKKNIIICGLLVVSALSVLKAQEPVVQWGSALNNENTDARIEKILSNDENGFYALRHFFKGSYASEQFWLEQYSYDNKMLFSKEILGLFSEGTMGNSLLYKTLLPVKDKFLLFYQGWVKEKGKGYYVVKELSKEGAIQKEGKELETLKAEKQMNAGFHHPVLSPDKSKLLILTDMPFEKEAKETIRLRCFDSQSFSELWFKEIKLNVDCKRGVNNDPLINNSGNVIVFKRMVEKSSYVYSAYTYNPATQEWKENPLSLNGKIISQYKTIINSKQDFIVTGFYATKNENNMEGTFYFRFDGKTLALAASKVEPFGAKLLSNWLSEKNAAKEGADISNLKIKDVLSYPGTGNILLIAEDYSESFTSAQPGASVQSAMKYTYYYKDILTINMQEDGSKLWATPINKSQREETTDSRDRWGSFVYGMVNNSLIVLWNNLELTPSSIPPAYWKEADGKKYVKKEVFGENTIHATFMHVIGPNGNSTYADRKYGLPLFNLHKTSVFPMSLNPNVFFTLDDGIILSGEMHNQGKKYKFGKIIL